MENLYRSAIEEKQNADTSYRAMKDAQFSNEIRAKHGVAIGELSQRIVQYKKIREYVQITAEEIQKILQVNIVLILLPNNERLEIKGYAFEHLEGSEGLNQNSIDGFPTSIQYNDVRERIKVFFLKTCGRQQIEILLRCSRV